MKIEPLPWDSRFFNRGIGKLTISGTDPAAEVSAILQSEDYDLTYIFADGPPDRYADVLPDAAVLYDIKMTYTGPVSSDTYEDAGLTPYSGALNDELLELALISGSHSRFRLDPKLAGYFEALYKTWMERSLEGKIADEVLVYRSGSRIGGMITYSVSDTHESRIGLISVHPEFQGEGIGRQLIHSAESRSAEKGARRIVVATQEANQAACIFYEKCSYTLLNKTSIFHYWS